MSKKSIIFESVTALLFLPLVGWVLTKRRVPYAVFWLDAFSLAFTLAWWFAYQQALAGPQLLGL